MTSEIDPLTPTSNPLLQCNCNNTIRFLTKHCYEPDLDNCTSCNPLVCHKVFRHTMRCKKYNECSRPYIPTPTPKPTPKPTQIPPKSQKNQTIIILSIILPLIVILSFSLWLWFKKNASSRLQDEDEEVPLSNLNEQTYDSI